MKSEIYFSEKQLESESFLLDKEQKLLNKNGDTIALKSLIENDTILFFRYNSFDCNVCIETFRSYFDKIDSVIPKDRIAILFYARDVRDYFIDASTSKLDIDAYYICDRYLKVPIEQEGIPFLFVGYNNYECNLIFLSHYSRKKEMMQYLDIVKRRFF